MPVTLMYGIALSVVMYAWVCAPIAGGRCHGIVIDNASQSRNKYTHGQMLKLAYDVDADQSPIVLHRQQFTRH